ncbi:glycoside hydrolase family protein [Klebsiella michiganensis]
MGCRLFGQERLPNQAEKVDTEQDLGRRFKWTRRLRSCTWVTLNQAQYDALVSLAFSCGAASPALDTVLTHLNHQRFADALSAWENIRSGREQRREECARFKTRAD